MLLAITTLVFVVTLLLLYVFVLAGRSSLGDKLKEVGASDAAYVDEELATPLYQRIFGSPARWIGSFILQLTPQATRRTAEEKLFAAGGFQEMSTDQFLVFWGGMAALGALSGGFVAWAAKTNSGIILMAAIGGFFLGYLIPLMILNRRIGSRKASIQRSLPDVLDLLSGSVEAGLSFTGAMANVAEKMKGPLVDEMARVLQETRMGMTRRDALKGLSERCGLQDVTMFTAALIQADQLGVSIAHVLGIQSENVRNRRRQRLRESAMRAPIKLLFPLIFFIFPTLFIVLLGPAMISIIQVFMTR